MEQKIVVKEVPAETSLTLSQREVEVVRSICTGKTSREVGEQLNMPARTVETHRHNIMKRLGCKNMPQLVDVLHRQGILS